MKLCEKSWLPKFNSLIVELKVGMLLLLALVRVMHMINWGSRCCWRTAAAAVLSSSFGRGGWTLLHPCPQLFPCPRPRPLWGPLLVRKPGPFSRRHPLPRQRQALTPNCWWVRQRPCWRGLTLVLGPFWRVFLFAGGSCCCRRAVRWPVFHPLAPPSRYCPLWC